MTLGVARRRALGVAAFSPSSITGLKVWLESDGTVWQNSNLTTAATASNDPVGAWVDASGNSATPIQATAGNKPTFQTGVFNGKPSIRFPSSRDRRLAVTFGASISQPYTIFLMHKGVTSISAFVIPFDNVNSSEVSIFHGNNANNQYQILSSSILAAANNTWTANAAVAVGRFNGASSDLRVDGGTTIITGNPGSSAMAGLTVGAAFNNTSGYQGDIGAILIYNSSLSLANMNLVGNYLATKYGTTWTTAT